MRQAREIQSFFYGQYFADGIRITLGTVIPALLFSYFGNLQMGVTISLGALVAGLADTPGPANHRRNGMFACTGIVIATALLTNSINTMPILLGMEIVLLSFFYSMFAVYGVRAATVGAMGILVMILNTDVLDFNTVSPGEQALLIGAGCGWYMLLSLSVTQFRPYRLAQQELGEAIHNVADYIRIKANFYDIKKDNDKNYAALIDLQIHVHGHQETVREILFKSKKTIKDTTPVGRALFLVFSDIVDLFEQSMATHYDYDTISQKFGDTKILRYYKLTIRRIANELDHLAYQVTANKHITPHYDFSKDLEHIKGQIDLIEKEGKLNTLPLKKILVNIRNLVRRLNNIYGYFGEKNKNTVRREPIDHDRFISEQQVDLKVFVENLNLKSTKFRHALRMGIVMGIGYIISLSFDFGTHSYWILLTILVILKSGFGLTKQRNFQRLIGTIVGSISGALIIILVKDQTALFMILLIFMIATYSLIRINYIVSVMFMTPFILIMFSLMEMNIFEIAQERIVDTLIGSALAFTSSYVIFPNWERTQVYGPIRKLLIANYNYLAQALQIISGQQLTETNYKLARKEVYIATANMGSAFQRMITELKSKQTQATEVNKIVVFNHILSSYSVTLLNLVKNTENASLTGSHVKMIRKTLYLLAQSIKSIPDEEMPPTDFSEIEVDIPNNLDDNNINSEESELIAEQLAFLNRIAVDLNKTIAQLLEPPKAPTTVTSKVSTKQSENLLLDVHEHEKPNAKTV